MGLRENSGLKAILGALLLAGLAACTKEPEKPKVFETLDLTSTQEQGPYSLRPFSGTQYAVAIFGGLPAAPGAELCSALFSAEATGVRCSIQQVDVKKGEWIVRFDEKSLLAADPALNLIPGVAVAATVGDGKQGSMTRWKIMSSQGGYAFESVQFPAWYMNMYGNTPTRFKTGQLDGRIVVANSAGGDQANAWMLVRYP